MRRLSLLSTGVLLLATLGLSGETTSAAPNLLKNPGFEAGEITPEGWSTFPRRPRGIAYVVDDAQRHSGKRSALVEGTGRGFGMWQQVVDVQPGRVYVFTGYVAFEDISPPGECRLQLVFRDADNDVIQFVNFPAHTGTREFALDFPPKLKVRAPDGAARVEVNLYLSGTGKAWFDDVFFGLAPTGEISGTVTSGGKPLQDARVHVWGDPWGKTHEALTDSEGRYRLADIPVAFPRYVLMAAKDEYRTRPVGDIEVKEGGDTSVDFQLQPGSDPDDLRVKFGTLSLQKFVPGGRIPDGAVIPDGADGYAKAIRPYLASDEYIQSDHPDVIAKAKQLVETLPAGDRHDTRKVAWVIYEWVSRHIDHDGVFSDRGAGGLKTPYRDVTSGIWQTIAPDGWCWGKSFLDWGYRPDELLKVECGICVEHAWLVSAMFRSLNVPARASIGSLEFWAQAANGKGVWVHMSTTGGRTSFRQRGTLGPGRSFEGGPLHARFSVLSRPILHEDWNAKNKGLWRERHPWGERYEGTEAGYQQAKADLKQFAVTGEAPRARRSRRQGPPPGRQAPRLRPPRREQGAGEQHDLAVQRRPRREPPGDSYQVHYSDVTINLLNMDGQQTLDVRFPLVTQPAGEKIKAENFYWTNHPECVKRTWIEEIKNPPAEGTERWFHVEFDLRKQPGPRPAQTPRQGVDRLVVEQDVTYGKGPNARYQTLDIIHHKDKSRRRPAIVMIHGGAFRAGDKRSYHGQMREYAQLGYVTLSINYRLSQVAKFPAAVADCKLAIRWLRAHADRYGVDPKRIGATGGSSGGYLTAMVALADASDGLEGDGPYRDQSSRVQAAVPCCGAYDWRAGRVAKLGMREDDPVHIGFLGGSPTEIPEIYERASPVVYISKGDPPLLIFHGKEDRVVNVLQATAFGKALKKAGADYELIVVEGAGHGGGLMRANGNDRRMATFFAKHLKPDAASETILPQLDVEHD